MITVKTKVDLSGTTRRRKRVVCDDVEMPGRLPRITRLMALAIRFDDQEQCTESCRLPML